MKMTDLWVMPALIWFSSTSCASSPSTPAPTESMTQMMPMGGWHYRSPYGRQYFSGSDIRLEGTVTAISEISPQPRMMKGVEVVLETAQGARRIHLGPYWYIREQDLALKAGDKIEVSGRAVGAGQNSVVIASEIRRGNSVWKLRDSEGIPHWCALREPLQKTAPEGSGQPPPQGR